MGVQVLSYESMKVLDSVKKVSKVLKIVKKGDIVMIEGKLTPEEETYLISSAMQNVSGKFSGIEIAFLQSSNVASSFVEKIRESLIKALAKDRIGITVIGPSKVVKEIKMDPSKLEILLK